MSIDSFIEKQKIIQNDILDFLDDIIEDQDILKKMENFQITNQKDFKIILYFIVDICNNRKRSDTFFSKIEKILEYYITIILKNYSNYEIFHIFQSNKRILLFLIEKNVLYLDDKILQIMSLEKNKYQQYLDYFSPELNQNDMDLTIFNQKRKNGENDSYICQLIQNDSIIEFIKYINQTNIPLTTQINTSVFETNLFLLKKNPNLIEYSAFYGSIQIFQYLFINKVSIDAEIWPYAIHGRNAEIIHFLEEKRVELSIECIKESIKCHCNEITDYFLTNYSNLSFYTNSYIYSSIKYYNFEYFPKSLNDDFSFYYLCKYDYYFIVENLLNTKNIDINTNITKFKQFYSNSKCNKREINLTSITAAAKKMNLDIFHLLLKQKNIEMGDYCFCKCDEIEEINIPSSVTSIGNSAFTECTLIKEISIPSSVTKIGYYAFNKCSSLTQISLPPLLTSIKECAFHKCSNLKEITIPSSLKSIGYKAFEECSSLEKVLISSNSSQDVENKSFNNEKIVKDEFLFFDVLYKSSVGCFAFSGCKSLKQVSIPSLISAINLGAFTNCSMLSQVSIPSSVTKIESCAFCGCSSLEQILISSSVAFIGDYAFSECSSLIKISIPSSVNKIKSRTFNKCSSLKEIIFEDDSSLSSLGKYAFFGCSSLTKISFPTSLKIIKRGCFSKCTSLLHASIPSSVIYIECFAFNGNSSLTDVCLSSSMDIIENCTFKNCESLKKIIIPSSVERIESYAFFGCKSLSEVIILPSRAIIEDFAFPPQALLVQFWSESYEKYYALSDCMNFFKFFDSEYH